VKIWALRDDRRDNLDERSDNWPDSGTILAGHHGPVDAIAFSPDSQLLASGGVDCTIKIWQPNSQTLLNTLTDHAEPITALAFSPNCELDRDRSGYLLASGSVNSAIEIWHLDPQAKTATVLTDLTGHAEAITSVKFSPDGSLLASASIDRTIKIWQLDPLDLTASLLCTLTGHLEPVLDLGFRDDRTLASCSADGQVKLWTLYI